MQHDTRYKLAKAICARTASLHPGALVVGGVYGSTARGTDTEWSDLDLLLVVNEGSELADKHFVFQSIAVGCSVISQRRLEKLVSEPSLEWPFHLGMLAALQVLHGDPALVQAWIEQGQAIPKKQFHTMLERQLPALVFESYGRVRSCGQRRNVFDAGHAAIEVMYEMNKALCLLNGRWVTHDYYAGFEDAFAFPLLPDNYQQLIPQLWQAHELDHIVTLAGTLVANYWKLLTHVGLNVVNYQAVDDLPL